jgi:hypothetical protein
MTMALNERSGSEITQARAWGSQLLTCTFCTSICVLIKVQYGFIDSETVLGRVILTIKKL